MNDRFRILTLSLLLPLATAVFVSADEQPASNVRLGSQLDATAAQFAGQTPPEAKAVMEKAVSDLRASHIVEHAKKAGDVAPEFSLKGADGKSIALKKLLKKGPVVLVFYRGGWCPYCNLQLRDLQKHLSEIRARGAQLVAVSPQTPDASLSTSEKAGLTFTVLSDVGNKVARTFGIVYPIPDDLKAIYTGFGLDLNKSNGDGPWELPLAATYVIQPDGKISYAFIDADYRKRPDTEDVIAALK